VVVPESLHRAVRARRDGWRVYLTPGGVPRLLAPVAWCLAMVLIAVMGVVGVAMIAWPFVPFVWVGAIGNGPEAVGVVFAIFLSPPIGSAIANRAVCLGQAAWGFAVAFHRIDIRPAAVPAQLVFAGWVRGPVIDIADLSWVLVRWRRPGPELVLCVGDDRTVVCPAPMGSPLRRGRIHLPELAKWLGQALAFAEIPVAYYRSALRPGLARHGWLGARVVAPIWQVTADEVPAVAARYGVRTTWDSDEPRFAVDDVEWCAQWAGTMSAAQHDEPLL
jgi:hypothetical protein